MKKNNSKIVFISGVDGVGKTTIINGFLSKSLKNGNKWVYRWKRNFSIFGRCINLLAKLTGHNRIVNKGIKTGIHNYNNLYKYPIFLLMIIDLLIWRLALNFLKIENRSIIYDRSPVDYIIDLCVSTRSPEIVIKLSSWFITSFLGSYKTVLLTCNPAEALKRRPDIVYDDARHFRRYLYKKISTQFNIKTIDTTKCSIDQGVECLIKIVK